MSRADLRVALVTSVLFGACAPAPPRFTLTHSERRGRFGNGLRPVLMPDATAQQVELDVRYNAGSREDPERKAGLAHAVEHLMFEQRSDGADKIDAIRRSYGCQTIAPSELDREREAVRNELSQRAGTPRPRSPSELADRRGLHRDPRPAAEYDRVLLAQIAALTRASRLSDRDRSPARARARGRGHARAHAQRCRP